jgi:hypothetical protein
MGTGVKVSATDRELGRAVALDVAWYMATYPHNTEADIAAHLAIHPCDLSNMKKGEYSPKAKHLIAMDRLGMKRTRAALNEICEREERTSTAAIAMSRAIEQHATAGATTSATLAALADNKVTKAELLTIEARVRNERAAGDQLLNSLRAIAVDE